MPGGQIRYGILLNLQAAGQAAVKGVTASLKRVADQTRRLSQVSRRMLLGLAGALAGVTWAAAEQEKADVMLAAALKATGDASDETYKRMKDLASEIQELTVYGDEMNQALIAQALNLGISTDRMDETIKGAVGLATALDMDLNTALRYTALALQGEYTVLQRYVPALRTAETEAEKLAIVQGIMAKGFQQAEAERKTLSGGLKALKNALGDVVQQIGMSILGTETWAGKLKGLEDRLVGLVKWIKKLTDEQKKLIVTGLKVIAVTLAFGAVLSPLLRTLAALTIAMNLLNIKIGLTVGVFLLAAGAAVLVAESLGLIDWGLTKMLGKLPFVDRVWTATAECWLNAKNAVQLMGLGVVDAITKIYKAVFGPMLDAYRGMANIVLQIAKLRDALTPFGPDLAPTIENILETPLKVVGGALNDLIEYRNELQKNTERDIKKTDALIEQLWAGAAERAAERQRARTAKKPEDEGIPGLDLDKLKGKMGEIEDFVRNAGKGIADAGKAAAGHVAAALDQGMEGVRAAAGGAEREEPARAATLRRIIGEKAGVAALLERGGFAKEAHAKREEMAAYQQELRELLSLFIDTVRAERAETAENRRLIRDMDRRLNQLGTARA